MHNGEDNLNPKNGGIYLYRINSHGKGFIQNPEKCKYFYSGCRKNKKNQESAIRIPDPNLSKSWTNLKKYIGLYFD